MRFKNVAALMMAIGAVAMVALQCQDKGSEPSPNVNHPPSITTSGTISTLVGQRLLYRAAAVDPEGTIPAISYINIPIWLSVSVDSIFGVTPDGAVDTSFVVIASDLSLADTLVVSITIGTVNHVPQVTSPDTATAVETEQFEYIGTAADPDGTTPTIIYEDYASWMAPEGSTLHGHAPAGTADTSFSVIASDGLLADTLIVSITIHPAPVLISYAAQIQPVFSSKCAVSGCHMGMTPAAGLRLMNYNSLTLGGISGTVITPFEPDNSILIQRIEGSRVPRMPATGPPFLPDSTIQLIRTWIAQGALDN